MTCVAIKYFIFEMADFGFYHFHILHSDQIKMRYKNNYGAIDQLIKINRWHIIFILFIKLIVKLHLHFS